MGSARLRSRGRDGRSCRRVDSRSRSGQGPCGFRNPVDRIAGSGVAGCGVGRGVGRGRRADRADERVDLELLPRGFGVAVGGPVACQPGVAGPERLLEARHRLAHLLAGGDRGGLPPRASPTVGQGRLGRRRSHRRGQVTGPAGAAHVETVEPGAHPARRGDRGVEIGPLERAHVDGGEPAELDARVVRLHLLPPIDVKKSSRTIRGVGANHHRRGVQHSRRSALTRRNATADRRCGARRSAVNAARPAATSPKRRGRSPLDLDGPRNASSARRWLRACQPPPPVARTGSVGVGAVVEVPLRLHRGRHR